MTCNMYRHQLLLAALACLVFTVQGQHTPFEVGVGIPEEVERTPICTDDELAFIKESLQEYIVGLGRLFFRDETFDLPYGLQDIDTPSFSEEAFANFNAYEVEKYGGTVVGEDVQITVTDPPDAFPAPSPGQMPLEAVHVHVIEDGEAAEPSSAPASSPIPRRKLVAPGAAAPGLRGLRGKTTPASLAHRTATVTGGDVPISNSDSSQKRELSPSKTGGFLFYYGGQGEYTCRYCVTALDRRQLLNAQTFLVSSLETIMTFGLTADLSWNYKAFLEAKNEPIGCLGNGDGISVVLELTAVRPVDETLP